MIPILLLMFMADTLPAGEPPKLDTGKFWRLMAKAQSLRQAANATAEAKRADAAEEEVKKEQADLEKLCGVGFVLRYDTDTKSKTFEDLKCEKVPEKAPDKKDK